MAQSGAGSEGDSGAGSGVPGILKSLGAPALAGPVEGGWFRARRRQGCAPDGVKRGRAPFGLEVWAVVPLKIPHAHAPQRAGRGRKSDADGGEEI